MHVWVADVVIIIRRDTRKVMWLCQAQWKDEVAQQLQVIQVEGSNYKKVEDDLIQKRREELRSVSACLGCSTRVVENKILRIQNVGQADSQPPDSGRTENCR